MPQYIRKPTQPTPTWLDLGPIWEKQCEIVGANDCELEIVFKETPYPGLGWRKKGTLEERYMVNNCLRNTAEMALRLSLFPKTLDLFWLSAILREIDSETPAYHAKGLGNVQQALRDHVDLPRYWSGNCKSFLPISTYQLKEMGPEYKSYFEITREDRDLDEYEVLALAALMKKCVFEKTELVIKRAFWESFQKEVSEEEVNEWYIKNTDGPRTSMD